MKKIHIIQHGWDGFGHQLHGMFSSLLLHNVENYYFDGIFFINKEFKFQHIEGEVLNDAKNYIIEVVKKFVELNNQRKTHYENKIHSHEIWKIPKETNINTLYELDNVFYFTKVPITDKQQIVNNIENIKHLFVNNKLPENRLVNKNIVIHLRQGDALSNISNRSRSLVNYSKKLVNLLNIFINKYHGYKYYIHTDGNAEFITNILDKNNVDYQLFMKNEHILNIFSDFIYSNILVASNSSLSIVTTFFGDHELIIIPDEIDYSIPNNAVRINKYIEEMS
jgi:hypothetical protein